MSFVLSLSLLLSAGLSQVDARQKDPTARLLEKGDTVIVTDATGTVIRGKLAEESPGGERLTLDEAERFSLAERIQAVPNDVELIVTLRDGRGLTGPVSRAESDRFALWVRSEDRPEAQRVQRWIAYEDVYTVFHEGKLALGRGTPLDGFVVALADARQIERTRRGSGGKGALIGLAAGVGVAALTSIGCCDNPDVGPTEALLYRTPVFGGIGAAIGYFTGRAAGRGLELVQWRAPQAAPKTLFLEPLSLPRGLGIALELRF